VTDFDQCGLGHYLFDLVVVLRTLRARWRRAGYSPELSDERVRETLLAGYESVRGLPPDHERLFGTLDVMQRVAAVNRNLELRASSAAAHEARGEKFLRQSVVWLERSRSW
jgi:Ser/Thr protein kinase RdoA (MazF antagonist)